MKTLQAATAAALLACGLLAAPAEAQSWRPEQALEDVQLLSSDEMQGRKVDTPGSARARAYLQRRFREAGLEPAFAGGYDQPFAFTRRETGGPGRGVNLVGIIRGTGPSQRVVVITAHYDHLGVIEGETYNGADDNASGVAAMLALAQAFKAEPPKHTLVFAALDAEEAGSALSINGARTLVVSPPVERDRIALNINFDMVGKSARGELYAAGASHWPFLRAPLETVAATAPVTLKLGHDTPDLGPDDWTGSSDHAAFHAAGIPWVYFGVEDHPEYHRPTDDFATLPQDFFVRSIRTLETVARTLDRDLDAIVTAPPAPAR